jgi:hypothetical protein
MKIMLSLSGVMLFCASVVTGAGTLIAPAQPSVPVHSLSEPGGLLVLGVGFVVLASQVRRKKC